MKPIQKKSKSYYLLFLYCLVALIICSSGIQILDITNKDSKKKTKTKAEIIGIRYISDGNFEFKVIYFIKRTKYISTTISKDQKQIGDVIDVFYNDNDPSIITDKSNQNMFYLGNIIIMCACCMCLFILISLFSKPEKKDKEVTKSNNLLSLLQNNKKNSFFISLPLTKDMIE
jgi:hypothetical protein